MALNFSEEDELAGLPVLVMVYYRGYFLKPANVPGIINHKNQHEKQAGYAFIYWECI